MPLNNFSYHNIEFRRFGNEPWFRVRGSITNSTRKLYNTALFKISLFEKDNLIWSGPIKIRNFKARQTKFFDVVIEDIDPKYIQRISKHEIFFESGY